MGLPAGIATPGPAGLLQKSVAISSPNVQSLVGEIAGKQIRLYKAFLVFSAAATVTIKDGTTNLTGGMAVAANEVWQISFDGMPMWETSAGNALRIQLSAGAVAGTIWYTQS